VLSAIGDTKLQSESPNGPLAAFQDREAGLLDWLVLFASHKWLIGVFTLAGTLICAGITLILTPTFTATTIIMVPQQAQSTAAAMLGQLGGLAAVGGMSDLLKTPSDLYVGILKSRTIADNLIAQFGLQRTYNSKTLTDARKELQNATQLTSGKDSLIRISVEDSSRIRAAQMANAYVDELQKQNSRLAITESGQRRLFFEKQLESEKAALADAETAFEKTQKQTGMIQLTSQSELAVRAVAEAQAEIASREVALQSLKSGATEQNPAVVRQEEELKALRDQLRKLESSGDVHRVGNPLLPTGELPEAGLRNVRGLRDLSYHETLFELLAKQYEIARIDEAKNAPVIQIVDYAIPPEKKTSPKRALLTMLGAFLSATFAGGLVGFRHKLRHSQQAYKVDALFRLLSLRSR
jgi:LPS O-antigen subunit length determinant protein (WzzB/FepE family)